MFQFTKNLASSNSMMKQSTSLFKSSHQLIGKFLLVSDSKNCVHQKEDHQTWCMDQNKGDKAQVGTPSTHQ